jgi:hypothetical protein
MLVFAVYATKAKINWTKNNEMAIAVFIEIFRNTLFMVT